MLVSLQVSNFLNEFVLVKEEKFVLEIDFERLEEKFVLFKDKFFMVIKKGKGFV